MSKLFEPFALGSLQVKNRFVRSATGESRADRTGALKDVVFPIYEALADGGVGVIISGHMYVHPDWKCSPAQTGIWDDQHLPGLRALATASQRNGAKAVAQINYASRHPQDMTADEIVDAAERFIAAARRAQEAGFDGVQLHAAHGYLLSGFLTPSENLRTDGYGGDAERRRRLLLEIAAKTREAVGAGYPVLCKLGIVDGRDNSLPLDESVETARALAEAGVDAVEVSSTFAGDHAQPAAEAINTPDKEAYFAAGSKAVKSGTGLPVILVGGLRSLGVMERVVGHGTCDMVSLSRPFIREPDLVNKFREGTTDTAACISCNKCYNPRGFTCVFN